jgi:alpha-galactosidase
MQAANAMVDLGFKDAGYEYVVLDDCWSEMKGRDPVTSRLVPNTTKFPDGMSGTADKVHALGLKYGMYSSAGTMTCGRYPGSLGYEAIDAATFAEWGVDYLKVSRYRSLSGRISCDRLLSTSYKPVPVHLSPGRHLGVHTSQGPN